MVEEDTISELPRRIFQAYRHIWCATLLLYSEAQGLVGSNANHKLKTITTGGAKETTLALSRVVETEPWLRFYLAII
ncbi:hypothetical protein TNCT_328181 [Trichonephila clavata]|uniref:Uncharacterized protein n=1 Tax=Trichonephila clavata TaxID=2740835 RepID=A0A8X6HDV8_TRICU|nr:hypothetical protein TNCT_328181 [Trichonephila clavata]